MPAARMRISGFPPTRPRTKGARSSTRSPGFSRMRSSKRSARPMQEPDLTVVNPPELGRPRGFAHGLLTAAGRRTLFVAGQIASDADGRVTTDDFVQQFDAALANVLT